MSLLRVIHEELRVAGSSPQLTAMIAAEVSTALLLLAKKAEYMSATGPDVRAVIIEGGASGGRAVGAAANAAQLRNIALCSQLQELHR